MQVMGALFMGNKVLVKPDPRVSMCVEQFVRFMHECGLPSSDLTVLNSGGESIETLVREDLFKNILFTGSSAIAEKLCEANKGRVKLEDSGFDWKILGPDVHDFDYVSWVCD